MQTFFMWFFSGLRSRHSCLNSSLVQNAKCLCRAQPCSNRGSWSFAYMAHVLHYHICRPFFSELLSTFVNFFPPTHPGGDDGSVEGSEYNLRMVPGLFGRVRRRAGSFMSHEPLCPALPFESSPDPRQLAVTQKDWNLSVLGRVRNFLHTVYSL